MAVCALCVVVGVAVCWLCVGVDVGVWLGVPYVCVEAGADVAAVWLVVPHAAAPMQSVAASMAVAVRVAFLMVFSLVAGHGVRAVPVCTCYTAVVSVCGMVGVPSVAIDRFIIGG